MCPISYHNWTHCASRRSQSQALLVVPESSDQSPIMTSKKFWFLLLDSATGQPFKGTTTDFVSLPQGAEVADFWDAVLSKNSNKLASIDASDLLVYRNKAAFDKRNSSADFVDDVRSQEHWRTAIGSHSISWWARWQGGHACRSCPITITINPASPINTNFIIPTLPSPILQQHQQHCWK